MKILFSYRAFDNVACGVQKTMTDLMNDMSIRGHEIHLLTWDNKNAESYFPLRQDINWYKAGIGDFKESAAWSIRFKRMIMVRKLVKSVRPDLIIGFQDGMFTAMRLYTAGINIPVIAAERNAPSRFRYIQAGKYKALVFQLFRLARFLLVQCESYRNDYPAYLRKRIRVIPNPVHPATGTTEAGSDTATKKTLLSIGRLGFQKNYEVLVRAFIAIAKQTPDWQLVIVGEGEDRQRLEDLIQSSGLQERISLPGSTKNVSDYYCRSHLFCLPSRWEGFPNALAEAMAHGVPCVGFSACGGVNDLIQNGVNGLLVEGNEDFRNLSQALLSLMQDAPKRAAMGRAAKNSVKDYKPDIIFDRWERLFSEAIQ
jgi:glycosyltransferase involved in cell wall biosynthesis